MDLSLSALSNLNNQMIWSRDARAQQQQHMVSTGASNEEFNNYRLVTAQGYRDWD